MFQRQVRSAFPVRNIILLAAAILLFLFFWANRLKESGAIPGENGEKDPKGPGLAPSEWFHVLREFPDYKTDLASYSRAMELATMGIQQRGAFPGFGANWKQEGPANIGGRVNAIKVHPTNPNVMYVGFSTSGVWKTTDGGQNWFPIFDQQAFLSIGDIELDPQNPEIVYVGTGDLNVSGYPFIGDGLWKSNDGGQNWKHIGLENQRIISKIVIHPGNSNIIYAATMGLPFERNNDRGLYKTTDGGQNWQQILFVSDQTGAIDLQMSPDNPNELYVAMWDRIRNNQESIVSGANARIWKTTDAGLNWIALEGGLPTDPKCRIGIDIDQSNAQHIIAMYADTDLTFDAIYESFDGGNTWSPMDAIGLDANFQSNFAWYFGKTFINPFKTNEIYALGVVLWRSLDGGKNWEQASPDWWTYQVHADDHDMAFIDDHTMLLGTDGGLYRSSDSGASWEKIENIPANQVYRVAYNPFNTEWYFGGLQDNGTTGGNATLLKDWPRLWGGDGFQAAFHPTNPDIYYFETQDGNISGTTDGSNFDNAGAGIDDTDRRSWDMQYFISANDPDVMYTGTYRMYMGFGHLPAWTPISEDLTNGNIFGGRFHVISTVHESPLNPNHVYAGTSDGNVWHGNPFDLTWTNITAGLPLRYVSCVKASPTQENRVFVTHTGYKSNDFKPRIHQSDDLGSHWTPIAGDLPDFAINDLFILPGHQDSVLFVASDGGVYGSLNSGLHWERLGAGMPIVPVYDLEWNAAKNTLFAGTFGRSIYSFPLDSLNLGADVSTFSPNYTQSPTLSVNPSVVQSITSIVVDHMKSRQEATLTVCDLSGRIIWTQTCQGYGKHQLSFSAQNLPAGIYVVFAQSDGRIWGRQKFVVSR